MYRRSFSRTLRFGLGLHIDTQWVSLYIYSQFLCENQVRYLLGALDYPRLSLHGVHSVSVLSMHIAGGRVKNCTLLDMYRSKR